MLSQLNHPNIVRFYGICVEEKHVYLVTELCSSSLANLIEGQSLDVSVKARVSLQVAQGMAYIHSKGIYHRDLKPDNVLLLNRSGDMVPRWRVRHRLYRQNMRFWASDVSPRHGKAG